VANGGDNSVTKLRASDGTLLGTFQLHPNILPSGIAFDGENIWVTGTSIVELRASDGAQIGVFRTPQNSSEGVAFDGANIWVGLPNNTVAKL
jgi:sugar lactone lactonase YvrE